MTDYLLIHLERDRTLDAVDVVSLEAFSNLHPGDLDNATRAAMTRLAERLEDSELENLSFVRIPLDDAQRFDAEITKTASLTERSLG